MELYSYWRSSTAYRVRIALNLKGLTYDIHPVDLAMGAQSNAAYKALNPSESVPTLVLEDGQVLTQSMAILEWLDEAYPASPFLPSDASSRARQRAAGLTIATDIHPVNNLKVVNHIKSLGHDDGAVADWMRYWMAKGLSAFQTLIDSSAPFCFGSTPGYADICLVPQLYNARRWNLDLKAFARLTAIESHCLAYPAFNEARPELQPDAS